MVVWHGLVELGYHRCWYNGYYGIYHTFYSMEAPEGATMTRMAVIGQFGIFYSEIDSYLFTCQEGPGD